MAATVSPTAKQVGYLIDSRPLCRSCYAASLPARLSVLRVIVRAYHSWYDIRNALVSILAGRCLGVGRMKGSDGAAKRGCNRHQC
jgi:hypothetical protein